MPLETRIVRELLFDGAAEGATASHLSAASGLVRLGHRLFVVADDENHLAMFDLSSGAPGSPVPVFAEALPQGHEARKAAKADCETLAELPVFDGYPHGALWVMGSGSRPSRRRGALLALGAAGELRGSARIVDLAPLLGPLDDLVPDLNIEGAFVHGDTLCLLQRGNGASAFNARVDWSWPDVQRWLVAASPAPRPVLITRFDLGAIDGVPLSFTDAAALPAGCWVFSAAAEDTADTYHDGRCAGSAIGLVDAAGTIRTLARLSRACKVEGIAASVNGDAIDLLLVTDPDDRAQPALLLSASLQLDGIVPWGFPLP